nr:hypothetical protein [uncultured bacterium]
MTAQTAERRLSDEQLRELTAIALRGGMDSEPCDALLVLVDEIRESLLSKTRDVSDVLLVIEEKTFSFLSEPRRSYITMLREQGVTGSPVRCPAPVVASAPAAPSRSRGSAKGGICGWCHQQRIKDGVTSTGAQRWRCPVPHNAKTNTPSPRTARRAKLGKHGGRDFKRNPHCPGGHGPMNISGRAKGVTYYKCKKGCPDRGRGEGWSSVNLPPSAPVAPAANNGSEDVFVHEPFVRRRIAALNHHNSQNRDDIVQEVLLALQSNAITKQDLHDDNVLRGYIKSVQSQEPNRFRDVPLDAPSPEGATRLSDAMEG